jgi:cob(I)alamin adenosyltransferase
MKIYTKTGDTGETSLFGGERVKKSHPRVQTYGTLDEANSTIGLAISYWPKNETRLNQQLLQIQQELFQLGGELASPTPPKHLILLSSEQITRLESEIDQMESTLQPLQYFILPGGSPAGATLHLSRTIIRRAERECVELANQINLREDVIQYLNRLSDYLFVAARYINQEMNQKEQAWKTR